VTNIPAKMELSTISRIILLLAITFLLLFTYIISYVLAIQSLFISTVAVTFLYFGLCCLAFFDKGFPLSIFILTLAFFNIGGVFVRWSETHHISQQSMKSVNLVMISLYTVVFSYVIFQLLFTTNKRISTYRENKEKPQTLDYSKIFADITFALSAFTGICKILLGIEKWIFVIRYGYVSYYSSFNTSFPFIQRFSILSDISFWIYIFQNDKVTKRKIFSWLLYFLNLILTLMVGQRGPIVLGLLMSTLYWFRITDLTSGKSGLKELRKKFTKLFFVVVILSPAMFYFLNLYAYLRVGDLPPASELSDVIKEFLVSQGDSGFYNVNFAANEYASMPKPQNTSYLLAPIVNIVRNGLIGKILGTSKAFGQTRESAWYSGYWSYYLSYVTLGKGFLEGRGVGSSYIAEAFADLSFFGVFLINILYGFVIAFFNSHKITNPIINGVMFCMLSDIYYAPRALAFSFLGDLLNYLVLLTIILLSVLYYWIRKKRSL